MNAPRWPRRRSSSAGVTAARLDRLESAPSSSRSHRRASAKRIAAVPSAIAWWSAPDERGAPTLELHQVDPPQRPVAWQPFLEQRRDTAGQIRLGDLAVRQRHDVAPNVELASCTQTRSSPSPLSTAVSTGAAPMREPIRTRAAASTVRRGPGEDDDLAGVTGDRGALEVKDRPILGTQRDHVSGVDVWRRHVRRSNACTRDELSRG